MTTETRVDEPPLREIPDRPAPYAAVAVLALLAASLLALAMAPLALPDSYFWIEHGTSESGAQGIEGAWVARLGFVLFGLAVIWLATLSARRWRQPATALFLTFGVCMMAVAAFSIRPWEEDAPFDRTEDLLHSSGATVMGFAFALGVVAIVVRRRIDAQPLRVLDIAAIVAATLIPIGMSIWSEAYGVMQRLMFLVAYAWYGREAVLAFRSAREPRGD